MDSYLPKQPIYVLCVKLQGPVSKKILSPLVILSMEKTMVTKVIRELKSISRLQIFRETEPERSSSAVSKHTINICR